jgi:hypothetical protein
VTTLVIVLAVVAVLQLVLLGGLLRSHAEILRRLHDLGAGADPDASSPAASTRDEPLRTVPGIPAPGPAPPVEGRRAVDLEGISPTGDVLALRVLDVPHDTILVFLSSSCTGCQPFWPAMADPDVPDDTRVIVVTREEPDEDREAIAELAPPGATVVMSSRAWDSHDVPGSPYVVHVDGSSGRVRGEGTAGSWPAVRTLLLRGAAGGDARAKAAADARRERDADRHLLAAGIAPGDPSLYHRADGSDVPVQDRP